jgi:thiol-disulfide isomerase/thioredoxin
VQPAPVLKSLIVLFAIAIGVFHGFLKPDLDPAQIGRLEEFVLEMDQWQGRYPEEFELELMDGTMLRLSDEIGKRSIVLNFFATWCGPCREEMPELSRFAKELGDDRLLLLGIDVEEDREVVQAFLEEVPVSFPVALDEHGRVAAKYGVESYPTTVLIGLDGRIALYQVGAISNADVTLAAPLAEQETVREMGLEISRDAFLAALAEQPPLTYDEDELELTGRGLEIARTMPCPCGCNQRVHDCTCQTADGITDRLAEMDLEGKTDQEIMQSLNQEFCAGATS